MADRIKGITIEIGGDTTGLNKALSGVNKEIKSTQSQLKDVERLLKLDPSNTELLSQKQKLLTQAVADTKDKLDTLKTAESQVQQQFAEGKISQQQYDALQREIVETSEQLKTLEKQAANANLTLQQIGLVGDKFQEVGEKISGAGEKMLPVTAAITAAGAAAVKMAADFDKSMSEVKAISGATGEDFEALRKKAIDLGASTAFSSTEVANAMTEMAKAGWNTQQILDGMAGVLDAAAASGESLATVSTIVADAITGFGLAASDSTKVADLLTQAANAGTIDIADLGESFKYIAPIAGSLGYSIEDVTTALAAMSMAGIKGSQAGTALRTLLTNMAKPTDDMADAMDQLGVSLYDNNGKMYSLKEILDQLRSGFGKLKISSEEFNKEYQYLTDQVKAKKMTVKQADKQLEELARKAFGAEEAEKAMTAATLAGKEGLSGLLSIMNLTQEQYDALSDSMYNSAGIADQTARVMQDNLSSEMEQLGGAVESLAISFGDILIPKIRELVKRLQTTIEWFNNLGTSQKELVVKIALVVAAIGPLLIIIGKISIGIGALMKTISTLGTLLTALSAAGGPVLLVVAAITALSLLMITIAGTTNDYRAEAAALSEEEINNKTAVDNLYSSYEQMNEQRQSATQSAQAEALHEQQLLAELKSITDENGNVKAGYEARASFITGQLSDALGIEIKMTDNQIQNYKELTNSIDQLIIKKQANALLDANEAGYADAVKNRTDAFMAYNQAKKDVEDTTRKLAEAQKAETDAMNAPVNLFGGNSALEKVSQARDQIDGYTEKLSGLNKTLSESETAYIGYNTTIANYEGLSSAIISGDQKAISDAILNTTYGFQTAETATRQSLENQVNTLAEKYGEMKKAVEDGAPGVTQAQVDQLGILLDRSKLELNKLPDVMKDAVYRAQQAAQGAADFGKVGTDIAAGIVQGMLSGKQSVSTAASEVAQSSIDAARTTLDSHSPSRVMDSIGNDFDSGLANGILSGKGNIISVVSTLASELQNPIKNVISEASTWGSDLVSGLANGITSNIGLVTKSIKDLAEIITSYIHFSRPDIGPLREYEKWMPDMITGLANGIKKNAWKLTDQLNGLTGNMSYILTGDMNGNSTDLSKIENLLGYYLPSLNGGSNIVLDDGALVGKILPNIDSGLTNYKDNAGRTGT